MPCHVTHPSSTTTHPADILHESQVTGLYPHSHTLLHFPRTEPFPTPTMPLQELPAEVLVHILASAGSLADLRALAGTSRSMYALFRAEQASPTSRSPPRVRRIWIGTSPPPRRSP